MKVAILAPYSIYPVTSGGQKFSALFHKYLNELVETHIISVPIKNGIGPQNYYSLLQAGRARYIDLGAVKKIVTYIKTQGVTHFIISQPYFGWLALLIKKQTNVQVICLSHNIEALRFKSLGKWWWPLMKIYESGIYRQMDMNFFITPEDAAYALKNYSVPQSKISLATYGTEISSAPSADKKQTASKIIKEKHGLKDTEKIVLFTGSFSYKANVDALTNLLSNIWPLIVQLNPDCKLIVCGGGLPKMLQHLITLNKTLYLGFVDDIDQYYLAADVFVNPILNGGGIKTKLVEALANNCYSVSTVTGAQGVPVNIIAGCCKVVDDDDFKGFANAVTEKTSGNISPAFYEHFYWGNIAEKVKTVLSKLT